MSNLLRESLEVVVRSFKETPRGMIAPFKAFWKTAMHNPILEGDRGCKKNNHNHLKHA